MGGNNLSIKITADVVDMQTKFAVARAEANGLTSEMNKLARASAAGTINSEGSARLRELAGQLLQARTQVGSYAAALDKAGFSTSTFGRATEMTHGSISTATREFRALFDELSSGRTRMTPGTLAIIAQRVLGIQASSLLAIGAVGGLVAGLAYLGIRAAEAANALDQLEIGAKFAGNLSFSRQALEQFADDLTKSANVSGADARAIVASFAALHDLTVPEMTALTQVVSDFAAVTGEKATKAAEELAKSFSERETAAAFARQLGGVTQAQLNAAEAADRSGNSQAVFSAKLDVLDAALNRARGAIDQHNSSITASVKNFLAYMGAAEQGISADEMQTDILRDENEERRKQVNLLMQASVAMRSAAPSGEETLKIGVAAAEKENPLALQIEQAKSKITEISAGLEVARQRADQVSIDKLTAGLEKARQTLSELQFGPVVQRMREQMEELASSWDGTQSGLLTKQRQIAVASLSEAQRGSKEYLSIQQEVARLEVQIRQSTGQEIIANARAQVAQISGQTELGLTQRLEQERAAWQAVLASDRLTAAQRVEVQRDLNQSIAQLNKARLAESEEIAREDANTDLAISRLQIEARRNALEAIDTAERGSAAKRIAELRDLTNEEYQLNLSALQSELELLKQSPVEHERVYNQIRELKAKNVVDLTALDRQLAAATAKEQRDQVKLWSSAVGEIEGAESGLVSNLISGRRTLAQSVLQIGSDLVQKEIANDMRAMTTRLLLATTEDAKKKALEQGGFLYHLLFENQKTAASTASSAARTAQATTANATQVATATTAAAESMAATKAAAISAISANAGVAAAAAMGSVAAIPFVGWAMAPGVGAATAAEALSFESLAALDVGAWNVPQDMAAVVHRGETIMPATFASGYRDAVSGAGGPGGGGDTHHHHYEINALDTDSFRDFLGKRGNQSAMAEAIRGHYSRGGR